MENQKGIAPILMIVGVVLVLGVAGYFLAGKGKTGGVLTGTKLGGLVLNSSCDLKDPDLCKYINRAMTGDYFKNGMIMKTTTEDKDGQKSESIFELDGKENSKMTSSQNGKETMSFINLGEVTYTKDYTDGKWWKYESKKTEGSETNPQKKVDAKEEMEKYTKEYKDKTSYKKIGKEACGSRTCFKYQMTLTDMPDYVQYIYFDDREYLMRKTRVEDKNGMTSETSYEYQAVTITQPSPIKEGSPWGSMMNQSGQGTGTSGISEEQLKNIQEQIQQNQTGEETTTETSE